VEELETRMWGDLLGRLGGSMTFRLILQPMMAAFFAIHDGLRDAHEKSPLTFGPFSVIRLIEGICCAKAGRRFRRFLSWHSCWMLSTSILHFAGFILVKR
jgi:hypothetical protein